MLCHYDLQIFEYICKNILSSLRGISMFDFINIDKVDKKLVDREIIENLFVELK